MHILAHKIKKSSVIFNKTGTRKGDGIPLMDIKVIRVGEKKLLLDFIEDNLSIKGKE